MPEFIAKYGTLTWYIINSIGLLIVFIMGKSFASQKDVSQLTERVSKIETDLNALPSKEEMHELRVEMTALRGDLKAAVSQLLRMQHMSDLLLENELKEKS